MRLPTWNILWNYSGVTVPGTPDRNPGPDQNLIEGVEAENPLDLGPRCKATSDFWVLKRLCQPSEPVLKVQIAHSV